ncbi:MAG: diguanylate cyclase [Limnoraphis sp. WC205]|nr:diguanylate cyclase [Limnoraphis sp. WC205]
MNDLLKHFFSPRQIEYEYIAINNDSIIVEFSLNVGRFSDCPTNVKHGNEISQSFPELMGLEDIFDQLLEEKISHFELKGIARNLETTSPVYFDVYLFKNEEFTYLDGEIIILFDDKTEWMIREQKYSQIYKEYELSVSRLEQANHYTNKIIHSMNDMLLITNSSGIITKVNQATQNILEYREDELINQSILHVFSKQRSKNSVDLSDFILETTHSDSFELDCKTQTGREIIISFSCSIFSRNPFERQELLWIGRDITKRKQLELQLHHQLEQNRILSGMTQRIRQSLSLEKILQTTVAEVRQLLKADGVLFYHIISDHQGNIVANSFTANLAKVFQNLPNDVLIPQKYLSLLEQGIISSIDDINQANLEANIQIFWLLFGITSELIIPIITQDSSTGSCHKNHLWGVLIAYQLNQTRRWEKWEILLLEQLATPIAVAIQQAELYEQLKTANQELEKMAMTDGLTRVANHRFFEETLHKEWNRLQREAAPLSLILCDIDYFKRYNDTYGHLAGDNSLQQVAEALRKTVKRSGDLVARYGGEEFAIILPKTDKEGAILVAETICAEVRSLQIPHKNCPVEPYITISVGVASLIPESPFRPETLIFRADQALYQAKTNGRDRVFAAAN